MMRAGKFLCLCLAGVAAWGTFAAELTSNTSTTGEKQQMNSVNPDSIVRLSKVTVDPEQLEEYLVFAKECGIRSMAEEPGVLMMYSMSDKKQENLITILEIYANRDAYEKHIKTPHFQKYKQETLKMVQKLELLDQTPLVPEMKMK